MVGGARRIVMRALQREISVAACRLGTLDFEPEAYAELVQIFRHGVRAGVDQSPTLSATACAFSPLLERDHCSRSKPGLRQRRFDGSPHADPALLCMGDVQLVRD